MAYEKYITKNGKVYGPYVYHSKRVNGKVVSEYRGQNETKKKPVKKKIVKKKEVKTYVRGKEDFPPKRHTTSHVRKFPKLRIFAVVSMFVILIVVALGFFLSPQFTGQAIVGFEGSIVSDDLRGVIDLTLNGGELIPASSVIVVTTSNESYNFTLSEVLGSDTVVGDYYLENVNLDGSGEGYGLLGENVEPILVSFEFEIKEVETSSGTGGSSGADAEGDSEPVDTSNDTVVDDSTNVTEEEPVTEEEVVSDNLTESVSEEEILVDEEVVSESVAEEVVTEEVVVEEESTSEPVVEEVSEPATEEETSEPEESAPEPAPITGNVISNFFGGVANMFNSILTGRVVDSGDVLGGEVSIDSPFTYELGEGMTAEIVPGSVVVDGNVLDDSILNFDISGTTLTVTTSHSNSTFGFGSDYLSDEVKEFSIDLNENSVELVEGDLDVEILFNGSQIVSFSTDIVMSEMNETAGNETVEDIAEDLFEDKNITTSEFENLTLTEDEKAVLRAQFQLIVVNTTAYEYRDKLLVDFKLGDYVMSNSYDRGLSSAKLNELIDKDRVIWLKDLARELSSEKSEVTSLEEFNSLYPVM